MCLFFCLSAQEVDLEWAKQIGNQLSQTHARGTVTDDFGNVYMLGEFTNTLDFDPDSGTVNMTAPHGFSVFLSKFGPDGSFQWVRQSSSTVSMLPGRIHIDKQGSLYHCGAFLGTMDLDPGPDSMWVTSSGTNLSGYVQKFDPAGNLLKAFTLEGNFRIVPSLIQTDDNGNVYITGTFRDTIDFDPSPTASHILVSGRNMFDSFVLKLDSDMNFVWVRQFSPKNHGWSIYISNIEVAPSGAIYTSGPFQGTVDVDPDSTELLFTSLRDVDTYVLKMNPHGELLWARHTESWNYMYVNSMILDSLEQITSIGSFNGIADLDPSPQRFVQGTVGALDFDKLFFQRLDSAGNFLWAKMTDLKFNNYTHGGGAVSDNKGNIYLTGVFQGSVDLDLGPGVYMVSPDANAGIASSGSFTAKYDQDLNVIWVKQFDKTNIWGLPLLSVDKRGKVYQAHNFEGTVDFDPDNSRFELVASGASDMSISKWSQSGSDLICIIDQSAGQTCTSPGFASGHARNGYPPYTYTWSSQPGTHDSTAFFSATGIYTLTVTDSLGDSATSQVLIGGPDPSMVPDLRTNLFSSEFRPGFSSHIWVEAFNLSCTPYSGEFVLVLDPMVQFQSASIPPDTVIGDSLIWNVVDISFTSGSFQSRVSITTDVQTELGENLCFTPDISQQTQTIPTKSSAPNFCFPVVGSYDPNDKQAFPQGNCEENFVRRDERLTYTIRFQNTGTADAIHVFILDTLDTNLDLDAIQVLGMSHEPMITEILPDRVLKFRFDNIHLPDSNTNEALSHGYVTYEIRPLAGIVDGTRVENKAAIYFDFNDPVITNSIFHTLVDTLPEVDTTELQITTCDSYTLNNRQYSKTGTYFQHLVGSSTCDSVVKLSLKILPDTTINTDVFLSHARLSAVAQKGTYQWIDCDDANKPIDGANSRIFEPSSNGNYAVVIDNGICTATSACVNVTRVGVDKELRKLLKYHPNPTSNAINIELGQRFEKISVKITNMLGKVLESQDVGQREQLTVTLPEMPGVYFVRLSLDGRSTVLKVLKE